MREEMLGKVGQISTNNNYNHSRESSTRISAYKKQIVNPVNSHPQHKDSFRTNKFLSAFPWKIKNISIKPEKEISFSFTIKNYTFDSYISLNEFTLPNSMILDISNSDEKKPEATILNCISKITKPVDVKNLSIPKLSYYKKAFATTDTLDINHEYIITDKTVMNHIFEGIKIEILSEIDNISSMIITFLTKIIREQALNIEFSESPSPESKILSVQITPNKSS